ncbi:hypothetical protein [Parabacteroides sp. PF5-6]|uniref:hypothetical protein n=1 Tax=Parabacteroides sp. PF5-6 TaxID=1742403 RepID=UPI0024057E1C|nr:hypothetical protein [Parabacteroides sp. PF5-6]MDF9829678.1 putative membrane protein [Parabacteroides sp. PF5-6]
MEQTFTISEVVKTSWSYLKQQIWVLVGLLIGFTILSFLLSSMISPTSITMTIVGTVVSALISCIFYLGYYKNMFQTLDDLEPQFSAYGQQASKFLTYFIANIILGVSVTIGIMLLIVPGIYLMIRLQFYSCFIVEENAGIIDSLKRSWALTEGRAMQLFLLGLVQLAILIVGILLLGIGVLVAAPFVYMIQCYVFRLLNNPLAIAEEGSQDVAEQI